MVNDKYITLKKNEYALCLLELFNKKFTKAHMEYVHSLLSERELKTLNHFLYEEMNIFSKVGSTLKRRSGRRKNSRGINFKIEIDEKFLDEFRRDLSESIFDSYDWSRLVEKVYLNKRSVYLKFLEKVKAIFKKNLDSKNSNSPLLESLNHLSEIFNLKEKEVEILTFLFLVENDTEITDVFRDESLEMDDLIKSIRLYCRFFRVSPKVMRNYLAKDSTLLKSGILEKSHKGLMLSDYIATFLAGISSLDLVDNFFMKGDITNSLQLSDHIIPEDSVKSIKSLLKSKSGCNLLLFGRPGTGKTEFSKSLASKIDRPIYFINQYDEDGVENLSHRKSAIIAAQNILPKNSIIVVDECDPIIGTQDSMWDCEAPKSKFDSKAWINSLLESTSHKIIWICNKVETVDASTKRRFSYSLEFKDFTQKQREKVWKTVTERHGVDYISPNEISSLSNRYKVNAGGISLAIEDISSMRSVKTKKAKKVMLDSILKQHEKFVFGTVSKLVKKSGQYDSSVLNTSVSPIDVLNKLKSFHKHISDNPVDSEISNMNLLFYGAPGTGKTEFVKYLGDTLGIEVLLKRLSDIRSKWYGESLKNIASVFSEAEESGKILFLDEADSFFSDRESSSNQYHSEETNELLTQMENFKGILACSTNMLNSMDQAVLRRFTVKVSFDYLSDEGKVKLFENFFLVDQSRCLNTSELESLLSIPNLTPGDYKVVKHKYFFDKGGSLETYIKDLSMESSIKKVNKIKIGFSGGE